MRARRQGARLDAPGAALNAWRHRYLECHPREDGSLCLEGRLPAEVGALFLKALERAMEWMGEGEAGPGREAKPGTAACRGTASAEALGSADNHGDASAESSSGCCAAGRAEEVAPSPGARRADALAVLAERFLAKPPSAEDTLPTAERYLLTVHAPVEALAEFARIDPDDPPHLEGGPALAPETVRRLGCDAALVRLLETGAGEPLDVGRKTRPLPPTMKRALARRDGGCRFPGCTHRRFVDGHHIVHWADGGATRLDNLLSTCRRHHVLLHEGGYYVVKDGAECLFFRGDGLPVPAVNDTLRPRPLPAVSPPPAPQRCAPTGPVPSPRSGSAARAAAQVAQPP